MKNKLTEKLCSFEEDFPQREPHWVAVITRQLEKLTHQIERQSRHMSQLTDEIAALQADVQAETTVNQSAITLINGFAQQLADAIAAAQNAGATPEALQALNDLHAAVTDNTAQLAAAMNPPPPVPPGGQ